MGSILIEGHKIFECNALILCSDESFTWHSVELLSSQHNQNYSKPLWVPMTGNPPKESSRRIQDQVGNSSLRATDDAFRKENVRLRVWNEAFLRYYQRGNTCSFLYLYIWQATGADHISWKTEGIGQL